MKHFYTLIALIFVLSINGQSYEFAIIQNSSFNFSVVAIPDFDSSGNTDISDIGFALMLPAGDADVANLSQFNGRALTLTQVNATTLSSNGLGDGTRDGFLINLPPGQTILSHTAGQQIVIVSFDVINMPTSGQLEILSNTDPIAVGLGGAFDSFYNANIDNTSTQDYFGGIATNQGSFSFDTLSVEDKLINNVSLDVYPNPTKNRVIIKTELAIDSVEIYDVTGKLIQTDKSKILNMSNLNSGVYFLRIISENITISKRIIKE